MLSHFLFDQPDMVLSHPRSLNRLLSEDLDGAPKDLVDDGCYFALAVLLGEEMTFEHPEPRIQTIIENNKALLKGKVLLIKWIDEIKDDLPQMYTELLADPVDAGTLESVADTDHATLATDLLTQSDKKLARFIKDKIAITDAQFITNILEFILELERLFKNSHDLDANTLLDIINTFVDYCIVIDPTKKDTLLNWFLDDFYEILKASNFDRCIVAYNNRKILKHLAPDLTASIESSENYSEKRRVIDALLKAFVTASNDVAVYENWKPESSIDELIKAIKKHRYFVVNGLFGETSANGKLKRYRHYIIVIGASKVGFSGYSEDRVYFIDPADSKKGVRFTIHNMPYTEFCRDIYAAVLVYMDDPQVGPPFLLCHPSHEVPEPIAARSAASATSVAAEAGREATVLRVSASNSNPAQSQSASRTIPHV